MNRKVDLNPIKNAAVISTLKTLRDQRDTRQQQESSGNYVVNPQMFKGGDHFVDGPFQFKVPFNTTPVFTFGQIAQRATSDITADLQALTQGSTPYVPLVLHPYVFGFDQDSSGIKGFYLGLYALTPVPSLVNRYVVSWRAQGKGTQYPSQRTDEAWNTAYNRNQADYLMNETGGDDPQ